MFEIFDPTPPDDPMVRRLAALRDEAEAEGFPLLTYLIEVALVEAERIAEERLRPAPNGAARLPRLDPEEGKPEPE